MKYKSILKIALISAVLPIFTAFVSVWDIKLNSIVTFAAYFFATIFFIKRYGKHISPAKIVLIVILFRLLPDVKVLYGYIQNDIWSLPLFIMTIWAVISGMLFLKLKKPVRGMPLAFGVIILTFMFFHGWDYWVNKINFGTFTGKVKPYNLSVRFEAADAEKNLVTDDNFHGKIILMDFWTTTCGVCFQKFPQVEALYKRYGKDASVMVLAVNSPLEEDKPDQAFNDIREEGYGFPVVIAKDESLAENLGVKGYPTTFVMDQKGQVVYKGDIEGAVKMVDELKLITN